MTTAKKRSTPHPGGWSRSIIFTAGAFGGPSREKTDHLSWMVLLDFCGLRVAAVSLLRSFRLWLRDRDGNRKIDDDPLPVIGC